MVKKLHDLGKKGYGPTSIEESKNEIHYPDICVDTKQCPFLKQADIGEKVSLLAICEVKSKRQDDKKAMDIVLAVKQLGEEADLKMTKAVEEAIGEHKELDDNEEKKED